MKPDLEAYAAAARLHGECTLNGDYETGNRAFDRKITILREFRKLHDRGAQILLALLSDPSDWVQLSAATHLLFVRPEIARPILQRLAASSPSRHIRYDSKMVLEQWDKGELQDPSS